MELNQNSSSAVASNNNVDLKCSSVNDEENSVDCDDASSKSMLFIPCCDDAEKPFLGQFFSSLEEGIEFYENYARSCGFDVRRNTAKKARDGTILLRYLVCNREGFMYKEKKMVIEDVGEVGDQSKSSSSSRQRRTMFSRCGCDAKVGLKYVGNDGYNVYLFVEEHNHELATGLERQFLKSNREMSFAHKCFAFDASKVNIGASQTHNFMKQLSGGYNKVGATVREFRNWKRDLKQGIGQKDAQIILDKFKVKKESCSSFCYDHEQDSDGRLTKLFWADRICRRNYELFGDVVSFDATYGTNKYNMVFVPFCGVDNHRKNVIFAAGLLSKEDIAHYTWIFKTFLKTMIREPKCIITDQCPAMRQAIPDVFSTARHRWCMWHIMMKLPTKVGPQMSTNDEFMSKIKSFVWDDSIDISRFEEGWKLVMEEFDLSNNEWLSTMYKYREHWIPAYFKDEPMLGLMRTTSWSESANAFFGQYNMNRDTLTEFYMRFETALEQQRQTNARLKHECLTSLPGVKTPWMIERDAAEVYTREIFYLVSKEIEEACFTVCMKAMRGDDLANIFVVTDMKAEGKEFEVKHIIDNNHVQCSCKLFERIGLLCRHAFFAYKQVHLGKIPRHLVMNRWTKNAENKSSLLLDNVSDESSKMEGVGVKLNEMWFDFNACMGLVGMEKEELEYAANAIKELKHYLRDRRGTNFIPNKKALIENLIGSAIPDEITVMPPNENRNKGCGSRRIKSTAEKAMLQAQKAKRLCRSCNEWGYHDSRNCPLKQK